MPLKRRSGGRFWGDSATGTSNPTKVVMAFAKILLIIILFVFAEIIIFGNGPGALWAYIYDLATEPGLIYKYRKLTTQVGGKCQIS
jgi:hypothetical protein